MLKKILFALLAIALLLVIVALLGGTKFLQISAMMEAGEAPQPLTTVSATEATTSTWESTIPAVGSVAAINGTTISTEVSGTVSEIAFRAGAAVEAGELLVRLEDSVEQANLERARAELNLAQKNLTRARDLYERNSTPQSELDTAEANVASAEASLAAQEAQLAKKRIVAPFAGQLGIRRISLGQFLSPGQAIVDLQSVTPIFVEFSLPQTELSRLEEGYTVRVTSSAIPGGEPLTGELTAINSQIDAATRNIALQATFENPDARLRTGMFVNVEVVLPGEREVLIIPQTAIIYNAYGDSIFLIKENDEGQLVAEQSFVRLGQRRGDFVEVLSGLEPGQRLVQAGAFKLRNDAPLELSDRGVAEPQLNPNPENQ